MRRIGIDVGGTFTDVVLLDQQAGRVWSTKVPSTPHNPAEGAMAGLREILALSGTSADAVGFIGHGTTIATNMIIEGKGARTALLTTEGFRDILEIRRAWRHDRADLYDLFFANPPDLVPRRLRREVSERVLYDGTVEIPLSEEQLDACLADLKAEGIEAVAICFLNSHVNPSHEERAGTRAREQLKGCFITSSIEVNPEIMEYERTSTSVMNAVLGPRCSQYAQSFQDGTRDAAVTAPVYFMQSNGGLMPPEVVGHRPVTLLESGPAGGVTAAVRLCERLGVANAITGDMGGTSFDVSLIREGRAEIRNDSQIKSYTVRCPNIDIISVGAGGGSLTWIDEGGGIRIGPESAGADPGPACYGRGGTRPTVTDCNVVLGYVDPDSFSAGGMRLDAEAARRAVHDGLAVPLGMSAVDAARSARTVANALMAQAIRLVTVERGYDPRDFIYVPFGGAGPVHAVDLARELQMPKVILPPLPGLFSAFGMLVADMLHDLQASIVKTLEEISADALEGRFQELESEAYRLMQEAGIAPERVAIERRADCCYLGQGETMLIELPAHRLDQASLDRLAADFEREHARQWNFTQPDRPVRLVNIRLRAVGRIGTQASGAGEIAQRIGAPKPFGEAELHFPEGRLPVPRFRRADLRPGDAFKGPLVVEEPSTRLPIGPSDRLEVDTDHNLVVEVARA